MSIRLRLLALVLSLPALTVGCICAPTSWHTTRDVTITVTEVQTGKPVACVPIRVVYWHDAVTPLVLIVHVFREPREITAETDENGQVVLPLADYRFGMFLEVDPERTHYHARFDLDKATVRYGGVLAQDFPSFGLFPSIAVRLEPLRKTKSPLALGDASVR